MPTCICMRIHTWTYKLTLPQLHYVSYGHTTSCQHFHDVTEFDEVWLKAHIH